MSQHNNAYKKLLILSRALGALEAGEIFELAGADVSNSQLQGWRVGRDHKHFRPIPEAMMLAYADGLIKWVDSHRDRNG